MAIMKLPLRFQFFLGPVSTLSITRFTQLQHPTGTVHVCTSMSRELGWQIFQFSTDQHNPLMRCSSGRRIEPLHNSVRVAERRLSDYLRRWRAKSGEWL